MDVVAVAALVEVQQRFAGQGRQGPQVRSGDLLRCRAGKAAPENGELGHGRLLALT